MNTLLITIPPLNVYLFFNRQIVAGPVSALGQTGYHVVQAERLL
ncbi:hypothetical protein [Mesorhizobium sp. M0306]